MCEIAAAISKGGGKGGKPFHRFPMLSTGRHFNGQRGFSRYPGGSTLEHDDAPQRKKRRRTSDRTPGCPREQGKVDGNVPGNLCRQRTDGAVGQDSETQAGW